jgi:hypothetical protein
MSFRVPHPFTFFANEWARHAALLCALDRALTPTVGHSRDSQLAQSPAFANYRRIVLYLAV